MKLFAFWKTSDFPYVFCGEGELREDGAFFAESFGFFIKRPNIVAVMGVEEGRKLKAHFDLLRIQREKDLEILATKYKVECVKILPELALHV